MIISSNLFFFLLRGGSSAPFVFFAALRYGCSSTKIECSFLVLLADVNLRLTIRLNLRSAMDFGPIKVIDCYCFQLKFIEYRSETMPHNIRRLCK